MAAGPSKQISPIMGAIIVIAVVAVIVTLGMVFLNKPKSDPLADEVHRTRGSGPAAGSPNAPMMGAPPKAGSSDYAPAGK